MTHYLDSSKHGWPILAVCATCGMVETVAYQLSVEPPSPNSTYRHTCRACTNGDGPGLPDKQYTVGWPVAPGPSATVHSGPGEYVHVPERLVVG